MANVMQEAIVSPLLPLIMVPALILLGWIYACFKCIDINTASKERLSKLKDIRLGLAQRIVEHREQAGPFKRIEDVKDVNGIGDGTYKKIETRIKAGRLARFPTWRLIKKVIRILFG